MSNLRKNLISALQNPLMTDKELVKTLVGIVYNEHQDNTLNLFLQIQELDKKRIKAENQKLYLGLQDAVHNLSSYMSCAEKRDWDKLLTIHEMYTDDGNLAHLIQICKAYFPEGNSKGASNSGKKFFDVFANLVKRYQNNYIPETGTSHNWAKQFDYLDYLKLVLTQNT